IEFATGAPADPYGFKPTDIVVQRDGSLLVSDWADDQRPKRGRGRIYRIQTTTGRDRTSSSGSPTDLKSAIRQLDSESYRERVDAQDVLQRAGAKGQTATRRALETKRLGVRGRMHAVWILAKPGESKTIGELLELAKNDPEARVQALAVR